MAATMELLAWIWGGAIVCVLLGYYVRGLIARGCECEGCEHLREQPKPAPRRRRRVTSWATWR